MKRWYVVQTYSGYENSVKNDLISRIDSMNLHGKLLQVLVPEEEYEETDKKGVKKTKVRKLFPGYLFLEMEVVKEIDDETWFTIRNTPKVTGFLGSSGHGTKPVPVPEDEMNLILSRLGKIELKTVTYNVGDEVEVVVGPFVGQTGSISKVDNEKETVTILIEMFGRSTPSELKFTEVKKLR